MSPDNSRHLTFCSCAYAVTVNVIQLALGQTIARESLKTLEFMTVRCIAIANFEKGTMLANAKGCLLCGTVLWCVKYR